MANKDNQSQRFIYIRSLKEKVPCTEQQFQEFYREATRIRKKEQYYHRCKCPKQFIWACDGDCEKCEHHLGYGLLSLDAPSTEDGSTLLESEELAAPELMEEVISDRILLEQLFQRLRELDPDADKIIEYWKDDSSISDREIAKRLGRKQRTFADQMKKIRTELRKVRGYQYISSNPVPLIVHQKIVRGILTFFKISPLKSSPSLQWESVRHETTSLATNTAWR